MMFRDYNFDNALIFPYGYEFLPILKGLLKVNRIDSSIRLVSPEGWGINGADAGQAFGQPYIGIKVLSDSEKHIMESNSVIAVPFKNTRNEETNQLINNMINECIDQAKTLKKNVYDLREICETIPDYQEGYNNIEIECPIITVDGITENLNKLDVMIELSHSLSSRGYKVSQIGTRHYCSILDMHPFPQFMFSEMNEIQKIRNFKLFVHNIYKNECPDAIIIGIPGAAIPFNDNVDNGYGIIHYLVSMSVKADYTITCSNLGIWDFEKLNIHFSHRFGHGINCVVISNTKVFYNAQEFPDRIIYEMQDYKVIEDIKKIAAKEYAGLPIIDIFNKQDVESLTEIIIKELADVEFFKL